MNNKSIDLVSVQKMIGTSLDLYKSLVDVFTEESISQMSSIENAITNKDSASLNNSAHSFKSSLAILGALDASSMSEQLEMIGKSGGTDGSVEIFEQLKLEFEKVTLYFASGQWIEDWELTS